MRSGYIIKYTFDRISAFFGLVLVFPLILIISGFIIIFMQGVPVIFKQKRVGQYGKVFTMYKFRTMDFSQNKSTVSVRGDSRITPIGAFLRKYKLDELPELWNVLIGEMSLVGPRPDVPGYADKLVGKDRDILKLKPGITGPASLKYANEEEMLAMVDDPIQYNNEVIYPDKVRINLKYMNEWSFWLDCKIVLYTLIKRKIKHY